MGYALYNADRPRSSLGHTILAAYAAGPRLAATRPVATVAAESNSTRRPLVATRWKMGLGHRQQRDRDRCMTLPHHLDDRCEKRRCFSTFSGFILFLLAFAVSADADDVTLSSTEVGHFHPTY